MKNLINSEKYLNAESLKVNHVLSCDTEKFMNLSKELEEIHYEV